MLHKTNKVNKSISIPREPIRLAVQIHKITKKKSKEKRQKILSSGSTSSTTASPTKTSNKNSDHQEATIVITPFPSQPMLQTTAPILYKKLSNSSGGTNLAPFPRLLQVRSRYEKNATTINKTR